MAPSPTRRAWFEQAQGGTIFLDEVGEMSPAPQVRLLRTLELGEVRPAGGARPERRHAGGRGDPLDLAERAVKEGASARTSLYRLDVFSIRVPPLRDRREDVPLLARHFLAVFAERGRPRGVA
ncbi:MAG: sigma 54-interacting transcriptional regulator [Vicinamibacteria bacterium]